MTFSALNARRGRTVHALPGQRQGQVMQTPTRRDTGADKKPRPVRSELCHLLVPPREVEDAHCRRRIVELLDVLVIPHTR